MDTILVDLVRYGHLLAVAVGLGAAAMADYAAFTGLRRKVSDEFLSILHAAHKMIWPALIAMWVTGIVLIGIRTGFQLQAFSPKLFAKLFVVTALTVNAVMIGRHGMALIARQGGLKALTAKEMQLAAIMGGVSSASWLFALALGSSRFLAASPAPLFLVLVPVAYAGAIFVSERMLWMLREGADRPVRKAASRHVNRLAPASTEQAPAAKDIRSYRIGMFPRKSVRAA